MRNDIPGEMELALHLMELPVSESTLVIDDEFMISDNLGQSGPLRVHDVCDLSKVRLATPFRMRFTMNIVCLRGSMTFRVGMRVCEAKAPCFINLLEGSIVECMSISSDAKMLMLAFSHNFNISNADIKPYAEAIVNAYANPVARVSPEEADAVRGVYDMIWERLSQPGFRKKRELALAGMRTIYCYLSDALGPLEDDNVSAADRKETLFRRFLSLLDNSWDSHRDLAFYADRLCVTPKYLSRSVGEVSGRTAHEWICDRVVLEAKVMLIENKLSIQQISDRLGFGNQSFFGTFFRRATGLSPLNYRRKTARQQETL